LSIVYTIIGIIAIRKSNIGIIAFKVALISRMQGYHTEKILYRISANCY